MARLLHIPPLLSGTPRLPPARVCSKPNCLTAGPGPAEDGKLEQVVRDTARVATEQIKGLSTQVGGAGGCWHWGWLVEAPHRSRYGRHPDRPRNLCLCLPVTLLPPGHQGTAVQPPLRLRSQPPGRGSGGSGRRRRGADGELSCAAPNAPVGGWLRPCKVAVRKAGGVNSSPAAPQGINQPRPSPSRRRVRGGGGAVWAGGGATGPPGRQPDHSNGWIAPGELLAGWERGWRAPPGRAAQHAKRVLSPRLCNPHTPVPASHPPSGAPPRPKAQPGVSSLTTNSLCTWALPAFGAAPHSPWGLSAGPAGASQGPGHPSSRAARLHSPRSPLC